MTARYAREELNVITHYGLHNMTDAEYYDYTKVWP
jgi:hypothetical protein